jgi:hypothetical protein
LFGSDTDVTFCCYIKLGKNTFVEHVYWIDIWNHEQFGEKHIKTRVMTREEFEQLYKEQLGTPMQFMNEENFEKFVNSGY